MRIAVSGTHCTGKSTLIDDFAARHPEFEVHGDPYALVGGGAGVDSFVAQLRISARRLKRLRAGSDAVLERCPLDFLAYLEAWEALGRPGGAGGMIPDLMGEAVAAMESVDLLVVLPIVAADGIRVPADEDAELRDEVDAALLTLVDDPGLVPDGVRVVEIAGASDRRLEVLEKTLRPTD